MANINKENSDVGVLLNTKKSPLCGVPDVSGNTLQIGPYKRLSLRNNVSWTIMGNTIYSAFHWGIVVLLAKIGSPEMVGQYALAFAVVLPVFSLLNLHLRAVMSTDTQNDDVFGDYLGLRLLTSALAFLIVVGITFMVGYRWETFLIIIVVAIAKFFESVSEVYFGLLQKHERMDRIAKSMIIKGPLTLVAMGIGVYFTGSLLWGVVGLAVAWGILFWGYDVRSAVLIRKMAELARKNIPLKETYIPPVSHPNWEPRRLMALMWLSLPLGLVMLLISLTSSIPRYFIERTYGESQLGIFAAVVSLMGIGNIVVQSLGRSASPRLAKNYASGNYTNFRTLLLKLMGLGLVLGVVGLVGALTFGNEILNLFFGSEYADHLDMLIWIMAAAAISYVASLAGHGLTAARSFKAQVPLNAFVAGVTAIACFMLIPSEGLIGAAIAVLIGAVAQVSGSFYLLWHALWGSGWKEIKDISRLDSAFRHGKEALTMPLVSVIIPTYRRPLLLRNAIASVLNQEYQNFELIVVDDGSNDTTGEVVKTFNNERIHYIYCETHNGGSAARNTGIRNAQGEYIAFLDDDDEWLPEKLAAQCHVLEGCHPEVGVVYTGYIRVERTSGKQLSQRVPTKRGDLSQELYRENCIGSTSSLLVKKECFEKAGLFDESFPCFQDYDMLIRISKMFQITYINQPLLKYYVDKNTISRNPETFRKGIIAMINKYGKNSFVLRSNYCQQYLRLGFLYFSRGNVIEGRRAYLEAIRICPWEVKPYLSLCLSVFAKEIFQKIINSHRTKKNLLPELHDL